MKWSKEPTVEAQSRALVAGKPCQPREREGENSIRFEQPLPLVLVASLALMAVLTFRDTFIDCFLSKQTKGKRNMLDMHGFMITRKTKKNMRKMSGKRSLWDSSFLGIQS